MPNEPERLSAPEAMIFERLGNMFTLAALASEMCETLVLYLKTYADTDHHPSPSQETLVINAARSLVAKMKSEQLASTVNKGSPDAKKKEKAEN